MKQGNDEKPKTDRDSTIARLRMLTTKSRSPQSPAKDGSEPDLRAAPAREQVLGTGVAKASGADPPLEDARTNTARKSTADLQGTSGPTRSSTSRSQQSGDNDWAEAAHRVFLSTVNAKIAELLDTCRSLERERVDIESMRVDLQVSIENAEARIAQAEALQASGRIEELENSLLESNQENVRLADLLLTAREEFDTLVDFIEEQELLEEQRAQEAAEQRDPNEPTEREQELQLELERLRVQLEFVSNELKELREAPPVKDEVELEGLRQQIDELHSELKQLREAPPVKDEVELESLRLQIEELRSELKRVRETPPPVDPELEELRDEVDRVRKELSQSRAESLDLRMQADDLSAKIARMKGPSQRERSQAMTWEERKQAMLEQLEAESEGASESRAQDLLEIGKVIMETSEEIEKREVEIQELRNLLQQQSISQDGLAIGAAAIAGVIDNDALVIAERMKLKELQSEWEQKQRQAEIEMSLERAKLARERLELQEKLRDLETMQPEAPSETDDASGQSRVGRRKGKWLSRLGLKEE